MEAIKEFMAMPITWGTYITGSLITSAIVLASYCGWIGFCKIERRIRHTRILSDK